ncbi:antA/AntB antirepressor family protein [Halomonas sp.]|uniref:antA/AntB antirepressor family protein n=1 Tax=Halomonas sp. TaxID=1486246 RepID=UPI003F8F1C19
MNDMMIPVFQSEEALLCNARDLHKFLELGRDFSTWFRNRIEQYGFVEGEDYITLEMMPGEGHKTIPQNGGALESITYAENFGQQGRIDYHLTLDTAKELAMVENNSKCNRNWMLYPPASGIF